MYVDLKLTKQCKIIFSIKVDFVDEVEVDAFPLKVCGVEFEKLRKWFTFEWGRESLE